MVHNDDDNEGVDCDDEGIDEGDDGGDCYVSSLMTH